MKLDLLQFVEYAEFKRFQMIGNLLVLLQQYKQIGNAVPVNLGKKLVILCEILNQYYSLSKPK